MKYYLFIGRWQPFHNAHKYIIDSFLNNGKSVCIAVRNTPRSNKNPYPPWLVRDMIQEVYKGNPKVKIIIIPDIEAVCVSRKVGYNIIQVPDNIKKISATDIRAGKSFDLPEEVKKVIEVWEKSNR